MSPPRRFDTVLVANRGEIASRIIRSSTELGLRTVAVFSDPDRGAPHVRMADAAVRLGPGPARDSYLRADAIIEAARATGAGAVHPGYGFLSEDADFARSVEEAGLVFVGPTPDQMELFGVKHRARKAAARAGVPLLVGTGLLAERGRGRGGGRHDRLPGDAEGHRRWRRDRHPPVPIGRRGGRRVRDGHPGGRQRIPQLRGVPGAAGGAGPPCRGPGHRGRGRRGGGARGPRLLAATPAPEGRRGGPGARTCPTRSGVPWPTPVPAWPARWTTGRPAPSSSSTTRNAARLPSSRSTPGSRSSTR